MKYLLIAVIISINVQALDWYCSDIASERTGNIIKACGISESLTEDTAREAALENAKIEFYNVCNPSDDCVNHAYTIDPKRAVCNKTDNGYKCSRLVYFEISDKISYKSMYTKKSYSAPFIRTKVEDLKKYPKVRLGMSKRSIVKVLGVPDSNEVPMFGDADSCFTYKCENVNFCAANETSTWVCFKNGKNVYQSGLKPEYTDLLD